MFRQLRWAVCPVFSLARSLRVWADISAALSESPRVRTRQTKRIHELLEAELS
jgi:hypothetical protein